MKTPLVESEGPQKLDLNTVLKYTLLLTTSVITDKIKDGAIEPGAKVHVPKIEDNKHAHQKTKYI